MIDKELLDKIIKHIHEEQFDGFYYDICCNLINADELIEWLEELIEEDFE